MPGTLATRMLKSSDDITALLARVAGGDSAAFDALYQATSLKLFGICVRILRRQELAEEILQEVYVRIWDKAETFDASRASPITWMAAIARNRALDEARKSKPAFADDVRLNLGKWPMGLTECRLSKLTFRIEQILEVK